MNDSLLTKFPLAKRRKFWKKMIEKAVILFFLSAVVALPCFFIIAGANPSTLSVPKAIAIGLGIFAVFFGIMWGLYGIYVSYYIKTYYYEDDNDFLTIKKGVFMPAEIHVQYLKIQDVYVDQDILDRILGIYDVHISSATYSSGIAAHIDGVKKETADGLKMLLLGKIKSSSYSHQPNPNNPNQNQTQATANNEPIKANFSSPISSEVYGLSSDWWVGELVKLAFGATITPLIFTAWISGSLFGENGREFNWMIIFWIWLGILVITIAYRVIYLLLWKSHYNYNFGEQYIYMKTGVLSISEQNMSYDTIQDVKINQSFVDRIFKVADVIIENASANAPVINAKNKGGFINGIVIEGLSITDAKKVTEEIKKVIISKGGLTRGL